MPRLVLVLSLVVVVVACGPNRDRNDGDDTEALPSDGGTLVADAGTGTDAGTPPLNCNGSDPAVSGARTLGSLSSAEQALLCNYAACVFGGYGKSKACGDNVTVSAKDSLAECREDDSWSRCTQLLVSDYVACQKKLAVDPCNLSVIFSDQACASFRSCAFAP